MIKIIEKNSTQNTSINKNAFYMAEKKKKKK